MAFKRVPAYPQNHIDIISVLIRYCILVAEPIAVLNQYKFLVRISAILRGLVGSCQIRKYFLLDKHIVDCGCDVLKFEVGKRAAALNRKGEVLVVRFFEHNYDS